MRNLLSILFIFLLASCASIKDPDFIGVDAIQGARFDKSGSYLTLQLHYFNPNKSGLVLKHAEGDAWIQGNLLGHFIADSVIHIAGNADFWLPVTLNVDMSNVLRNSASLFLQKEVLVKIEGVAKVGKAGIFIHYPIRYEGKQDLSLLLKSYP